jgi:hypothetical protein
MLLIYIAFIQNASLVAMKEADLRLSAKQKIEDDLSGLVETRKQEVNQIRYGYLLIEIMVCDWLITLYS